VLNNVLLQDIFGHAENLTLGVEVFLLQVITILAVQVANGPKRFGKNLKFTRSFGHSAVPMLE
jgi:hypothetical protein